jgi:hypothetical protein
MLAGLNFFLNSQLLAAEPSNGLPEQIRHYYDVCNAVNLYSTADERRVLSSRPLPLVLQERNNSVRLRQIYDLMCWLLNQEQEIDPKIWKKMTVPALKETPTGIAVLEKFELGNGRIDIRLTIYQDDRELIRRLVNDLDSMPDTYIIPPSQEKVKTMVGGKISRREIHTWVKTGENWIKREVNLVLVEG